MLLLVCVFTCSVLQLRTVVSKDLSYYLIFLTQNFVIIGSTKVISCRYVNDLNKSESVTYFFGFRGWRHIREEKHEEKHHGVQGFSLSSLFSIC